SAVQIYVKSAIHLRLGAGASKMCDARNVQCHAGQIEHDQPPNKVASGASYPVVELRNPFSDRLLGRQHDGRIRAVPEPDGTWGTGSAEHDDPHKLPSLKPFCATHG